MNVQCRPNHDLLVASGEIVLFASDMTVRVGGDVRLVDLQKKLAVVNQWLAIDGDENRSIAELVSINSTGPLRLGFGGWRDVLLGCQFTNHAGELITAGGRAVKNVAGYDLTKVMVGQGGELGVIQNITVRTYQLPAGSLLLQMPVSQAAVNEFISGAIRAQWLLQVDQTLNAGFLGDSLALDYYEREAGGFVGVQRQRLSLQQDSLLRANLFQWPGRPDRSGAFRVSVPPMQIAEFMKSTEPGWAADPAFGIVVGYSTDLERIRAAARAVDGKLIESTPDPKQLNLLRNLKQAFGFQQANGER